MRSVEEALRSIADAFELHLSGEPLTVNSRTPEGDTPLHIATVRGDGEAIEALVAAGAEIDARGDMGCTALDVALSHRQLSAAEKLLRLGASPHVRNDFGTTAFDYATSIGMSDLVAPYAKRGAV